MAVPAATLLIGANQRTGSTLLSRALADTGVAGRAEEYLLTGPPEAFPPGWAFWEDGLFAQGFDVRDREAYLDLVYRIGTTPNGVFAVKMMWNQIPWIHAKFDEMDRFAGRTVVDVFQEVFPVPRVVTLVRRDRVAQAVSWARAAQDGVWVVSESEPASPSAEPTYDPELIRGLLGLIAEGEAGWRTFSDELGAPRHEVVYEDLVDPGRYPHVVAEVLEFLEVEAPAEISLPRTIRQADALNDGWVARFRAEEPDHEAVR